MNPHDKIFPLKSDANRKPYAGAICGKCGVGCNDRKKDISDKDRHKYGALCDNCNESKLKLAQ